MRLSDGCEARVSYREGTHMTVGKDPEKTPEKKPGGNSDSGGALLCATIPDVINGNRGQAGMAWLGRANLVRLII